MSKRNIEIVLGVLAAILVGLAVIFASDTQVKTIDFTTALNRVNVNMKPAALPAEPDEKGVIADEAWADIYPDIYASYMSNSDNSYTVSYLDTDPYLKNLYEGYGFAKMYLSARGHSYSLEDVSGTARPHPLANCLTCKTADYTALVNKLGEKAYSMPFDEAFSQVSLNVGCYNCHENSEGEPGKLVVTHDYINTIADRDDIAPEVLACGQCHIEYYFKGENKATSIPYSRVSEMSPTAILNYYDSVDFADWTQETTGARMIKAQHPEMETFLGEGSKHASLGLTCADCHMPVSEGADGKPFVSHRLVSPIEDSEEGANIRANVCATCHGDEDMRSKVLNVQDQVSAREKQVGQQLSDLKDKLEAANKDSKYTEAELNQIRYLYRAGQWYFDFTYVENSEGAHNSQLANECLAKAEVYVSQAMKLFK